MTKRSNRAFEDRYFRLNTASFVLEMYYDGNATGKEHIIATMKLDENLSIREPKKKRKGAEHAIRLDVDVPEGSSGSVRTQAIPTTIRFPGMPSERMLLVSGR